METQLIVRIEAPAKVIMLRPLNGFVRSLMLQLPTMSESQDLVDNLELAFSEAFTNICRHAYRSREDGLVTIEIRVDSDKIEFRFEDEGEAFDPTKVRCPDLDIPAEGGLGIWLMKHIMDEYIYQYDRGGKNVLRLVKKLRPRFQDDTEQE